MKKDKIDLVRKIKGLNILGDAYLNTLSAPFDTVLIDNEYQDTNGRIQDLLMRRVFGDLYEDVSWFLYEWQPGFNIKTEKGVEYTFNTEEDYYKYLETQ